MIHDPDIGEGDVVYQDDTLVEGRDLETAVYLSLFTDAPAKPGDDVPPDAPRAGFWADAYASDGDVWGSRLWLLKRAKAVPRIEVRAKEYVVEALQWLIRDGLARLVDCETSLLTLPDGMKAIGLVPIIYAPRSAEPRRLGPWRLLLGL